MSIGFFEFCSNVTAPKETSQKIACKYVPAYMGSMKAGNTKKIGSRSVKLYNLILVRKLPPALRFILVIFILGRFILRRFILGQFILGRFILGRFILGRFILEEILGRFILGRYSWTIYSRTIYSWKIYS